MQATLTFRNEKYNRWISSNDIYAINISETFSNMPTTVANLIAITQSFLNSSDDIILNKKNFLSELSQFDKGFSNSIYYNKKYHSFNSFVDNQLLRNIGDFNTITPITQISDNKLVVKNMIGICLQEYKDRVPSLFSIQLSKQMLTHVNMTSYRKHISFLTLLKIVETYPDLVLTYEKIKHYYGLTKKEVENLCKKHKLKITPLYRKLHDIEVRNLNISHWGDYCEDPSIPVGFTITNSHTTNISSIIEMIEVIYFKEKIRYNKKQFSIHRELFNRHDVKCPNTKVDYTDSFNLSPNKGPEFMCTNPLSFRMWNKSCSKKTTSFLTKFKRFNTKFSNIAQTACNHNTFTLERQKRLIAAFNYRSRQTANKQRIDYYVTNGFTGYKTSNRITYVTQIKLIFS